MTYSGVLEQSGPEPDAARDGQPPQGHARALPGLAGGPTTALATAIGNRAMLRALAREPAEGGQKAGGRGPPQSRAEPLVRELTASADAGAVLRRAVADRREIARQPPQHGPTVTQPESQVPRPPGLPLDGGYTLVDAGPVSPQLDARISEGQLVTLTAEMLAGGGTGLEASTLIYGLNPAGQNAVGIVSFPRWTPDRILSGMSGVVPEHPLLWGHTAQYVRVDGRIVIVRSFAPADLIGASMNRGTVAAPNLPAGTAPSVRAGTGATPAAIYNDRIILANTQARTLEVAVTREVAARLAAEMPAGQTYGMARPTPGALYTAQPSQFGGLGGTCTTTNCIGWAVPRVQGEVGATITSSGTPVTSLPARGTEPVPNTANQGRVHGALGQPETLAMVDAEGRPLPGVAAGRLSTGMQVLKWGGRVMIVFSAAMTVREIVTAAPEERGRVASGAVPGFLGGLAAGAAAGLVCGPGALVCSIVLGIGFGTVGYIASRSAGEAVYDLATGQDQDVYATRLWQALTAPSTPGPAGTYRGSACPTGACHQAAPASSAAIQFRGFGDLGGTYERQLSDQDMRAILQWLEPVEHSAPVPAR